MGNIHRQKRRKAKGFRALYLYYMYFLGIWQPAKKQKPVPFSVRQEVPKLHRYQRQFRLLQTYRIDTEVQLSMLMDAVQAEIDALTLRRKTLYARQRRGEDTAEEIVAVNQALRPLRRNLKLCSQIEADIPRIRGRTQLCREQQCQEQEKGAKRNEKQHHFERGK